MPRIDQETGPYTPQYVHTITPSSLQERIHPSLVSTVSITMIPPASAPTTMPATHQSAEGLQAMKETYRAPRRRAND